MAEPVTRKLSASAGAFDLLEEAVHLLRAAPFGTLAWHWAGSLPMAIGGVFFWNEITNPHTAAARLADDALLLAVLFGWLNLCRAVFASRLRDQLAGIPAGPIGARALWRMAPSQVFLGATKLLVLPLAGFSTILLAPAVAFYRNAAVLAAREPDTRTLAARARRYARHQSAQNWRALGLIACVYPVVLVNLVVTLAILPQLARILTGYESAYSRLGARLIEDTLFWSLAFAITWLLFDPYVQAVYCVRCFQAESAETGEDVKAVLRRLGKGLAAALVFCGMFAWAPAARAESAPPADLQRAVQQAAQSPEYDWRIGAQGTQKQQPAWFTAATDRVVAATRAFLRSVSEAIGRLLRWIFGRRDSAVTAGGAPPAQALPIGVWVLILLTLAAAGYSFARARYPARRKATAVSGALPVASREDAEEMDPLRYPEQTWIDLAERALAEENFRLAMRAFYLASLGWLGRHEFLQIHSGKTNREYQVELRRRTRTAPEARELFARNVTAFERCWYGMHATGAEEVARFRAQMREMQQQLEAAA